MTDGLRLHRLPRGTEKMTVAELNARYKEDGWRSAGLERMCPRCQEDRLITSTTIHGTTTHYCDVCSLHWIPDDHERL